MAGLVNGQKTEVVNLKYEQYIELVGALTKFLNNRREDAPDEDTFNKMAVVALTSLAGILAVDSGMEKQRFLAISDLNYDASYEAAPKWA